MEPETKTPEQTPPQTPEQTPPQTPEQTRTHHATPLRTLTTDMADSMKQNQGKVIKAAIEEEERRAQEKENLSPVSTKNLAFIIGGLGLLIVALGSGLYAIRSFTEEAPSVTVPTAQTPKSLVRADTQKTLAIAGLRDAEIANKVRELVTAKNNRFGTITEIVVTDTNTPTAKRVPAASFLDAIDAHTAKSFMQSIRPAFMLGMYTHDETHVFLVLTGPARDTLVAGMREWEDFLLDDMAPLIGFDTKNDPEDYAHAAFSDSLVENRSVRAIVGKDGIPVLFYSFLNEETVVVTNNTKTFAEIVRRQIQ
jgi:hypothetical protein